MEVGTSRGAARQRIARKQIVEKSSTLPGQSRSPSVPKLNVLGRLTAKQGGFIAKLASSLDESTRKMNSCNVDDEAQFTD